MKKDKAKAIELISKKLKKATYLSYDEIADITGYHTKYLFKLKDAILDGSISLDHGNKDRKPINALSEEERKKIISLYRRSNASIRQFCKFYSKRSYSCIYNIIKNAQNEEL